jgi:aminobenzoyl-glutamate utilization protein B
MARCRCSPSVVLALLLAPGAAWPLDDQATLLQRIDGQAERYGALSRRIWEIAELGYKETQSSALLQSELRAAGFEIRDNVAGIPTAFVATWGQGKPVIGLMAEYDALPGLSQDTVPEKKAFGAGAAGHGCGHNLLGAASVLAAISLKEHLADARASGTIRLYGTPAEEGGSGKVYMARAGAFDGLDAALAWHPGSQNYTGWRDSLATVSAKFRFSGTAAHAAISPDKGRSALDALAVMTHATELLREHVPEKARIHYVITNGGSAPNIVPDLAEVWYMARHPSMPVLDGLWARVVKCAEGAALATETRMQMDIVGSTWNYLGNDALNALLDRNLRRVGGVRYSGDEQAFAEKLYATLPREGAPALGSQEQVQEPGSVPDSGSSDVGDVSWLVPTGHLWTATLVPGTSLHSWQSTACTGMGIGRKGMIVAAKTLALTAADLFRDPKQVEAARASLERRRAGHAYRSRIPADQKPPLNYRDR